MSGRVLITGGAGFIGSHVADNLLKSGYQVRALDNLSPQVHGPEHKRPEYLDPEVELVTGDVRDSETLGRSLKGVDAVVHLAAMVGVGQSMYEIARYTDTNNLGTAVLLEALMRHPVKRLVVASSMSIYGEGLYQTSHGIPAIPVDRTTEQLKRGEWELRNCEGEVLEPVPTPESKQPSLASIYALSKYDQEVMCLITGRAYGFPVIALRLFSVFGTRQSLSNPYTGVIAIFASRLLNKKPPLIFEDGLQRRDFVSVLDVADAFRRALEADKPASMVYNIGNGHSYTVREVAARIGATLGVGHIEPLITGEYRVGDIRHCFGDISLARNLLGYLPQVNLEDGIAAMAPWLQGQIVVDRVEQARAELSTRGLTYERVS